MPQSMPSNERSVAVAGFGFTWLSQNVGLLGGPHEVDEVASQVPDSDGVYFVPAFSGLFAPRWDDTARGVILGLTGECKRCHMQEVSCWGLLVQAYSPAPPAVRAHEGLAANQHYTH
eukprot:1157280-Pelagomonas_calceolata.AAC.9